MLHLREELPVTMRMPLQRGVADLLRPLVRDLGMAMWCCSGASRNRDAPARRRSTAFFADAAFGWSWASNFHGPEVRGTRNTVQFPYMFSGGRLQLRKLTKHEPDGRREPAPRTDPVSPR